MRLSGVRLRVLISLILVLAPVFAILNMPTANAAQITARSLLLLQHAATTTGGSAPGGIADHKYTFTLPSNTIGSILIQYCTTPTGSCTMPTGLVTNSGVTLTGLSGGLTGWTLVNTSGSGAGSNGQPYITHSAASVSGIQSFTLTGVTNPTTANQTMYVRLATYASTDTTGGSIDLGTVAASTTQTILISGTMPEYLAFCTGAQISQTAGTYDCTTATSGTISFGSDFNPSTTVAATSQMAAATNASSGYTIVATGTTLTSGSNTIPAAGSTARTIATDVGSSFFGINVAGSNTVTGSYAGTTQIDPASSGSTLQAKLTAAYTSATQYALDLTGANAIANSDAQVPGTAKPSLIQRYVISYFANVSGIQAPGTYTATINYVCTPTF